MIVELCAGFGGRPAVAAPQVKPRRNPVSRAFIYAKHSFNFLQNILGGGGFFACGFRTCFLEELHRFSPPTLLYKFQDRRRLVGFSLCFGVCVEVFFQEGPGEICGFGFTTTLECRTVNL